MDKKVDENQPTQITLTLPQWIVRDFQTMEKNTKKSVDELVKTSLMMFIATHNDYLGNHRNSK